MQHIRPLDGQVAIVTGSSRGIGRAIALALSHAGAAVALTARSGPDLSTVQREIETSGGRAAWFAADLTSERDVATLVQSTVDLFGRLDIVVNNAGSGAFGPLEHTTIEQWDLMMAVNARGPFLVCREAIPYLRRQEISFIINIASVVGVKGYINQAAYSASKHALVGMSKALAKEVQSGGIRVHLILPGGVDTGMIGQARPDLDRSVLMSPEEISDIVLFLVTRRGRAVIDEIMVRRAASTPWA